MIAASFVSAPALDRVGGVRHAFFTRRGGVSQGIYASLNVGRGSRDNPEHIEENRRRAAAVFGMEPDHLITAYQVHSTQVIVAEAPFGEARPQGDGVISTRPGLVCGALAADCAPILIADGDARVVAAVHAGWRGALAGVVAEAVRAMRVLGASPAAMTAAVGPCIGPTSYEVGLEFLDAFQATDPGFVHFFQAGATPDKRLFDLPAFVLDRLWSAGVGAAEWVGHDTFAEAEAFFSHRRSVKRGEDDYGRGLSAIMLTP